MIIDRIYTWARVRPDRTAIVKDGVAATYGQFARAIERTRTYLEKLELPERTTAAVLIEDLANCWTVCIALRSLGLNVITAMTAQQIHELKVRNLSCFVLIEGDTETVKLPPPRIRLEVVPTSLYADLDRDELPAPIGADERYGGHILYTSGTTGAHKKLLWAAATEDRRNAWRTQVYGLPNDFVVNNLAFRASTAIGVWGPMVAWHSGCCVVFDQTKDFASNLFKFGVTRASLVPAQLRYLFASAQTAAEPPHDRRGRVLAISGGFLSRTHADVIVRTLAPTLQFNYASTETVDIALSSTYRTAEDLVWLSVNGDSRAEIVDDDGRHCGHGEEGRLRIALREIDVEGYLDDPDASRRAFQDGCFYPGDRAVSRADGRIRILGRIDDVINLQGEKVAVAPIEQDLRDYLRVDDVCLFLRTNDAGDEILDVAIETLSIPPSERLRRVRKEFPLIPHVDFHIMKQFPRTATGKVQRAVLSTTLRAPKDASD
jgi:acyl-coenzyme A synthetase/AMP-(fatty) acid ligase